MAITVVNTTDTFEVWRQKTNEISTNLGNIDTLVTFDGSPATSVIDVLNQTNSNNLAMIIALG